MRNIDENAIQAQTDKKYLDIFIEKYEAYILHIAHKVTGRYITKRDDQWSIALLAFHEAVKSYDFDKGAFLPFAETVIKRRLFDYARKQSRHGCEVLIDSHTVDSDMENRGNTVKYEVMKKTAIQQESDEKLEIKMISEVLSGYGISFKELVVASPKSVKTKAVCGQAIQYLAANSDLIKQMRKTKMLPLKMIEKNKRLPRKVLERHRKYIIAGAEIIYGDYPILRGYLRFEKEESSI